MPALKIEKYSFNNSDNSWNYVEDKTWIEAHEFNKWKENFYSYLLFNPYNKIGDSPSKLGNIFVNHVNVNKNQTPNHFNNEPVEINFGIYDLLTDEILFEIYRKGPLGFERICRQIINTPC